MTIERQQAFINEARSNSQQLWNAINNLKSMQLEATSLDYANTLDDGTGSNLGITKGDVTAVVFTTTDAIIALLGQGHGTNIAKLL